MTLDHAKIRGDLDDCQRALRAWWALPDVAVVGETELQRAVEALLRAVSTLAHGLEAEVVVKDIDPAYEAAVADLNPTFGASQ